MTPYQNGTSDACTQPGRTREQHCARQLALPMVDQAPGLARQATRDALAAWRMTHLEETAVLVVSELVTNVVVHAEPFPAFMVLRLEIADGCLRIAVRDADPNVPRPRTPASLDESGFGYLLVDALADRWGVRRTPPGKAVWAELRAEPDGEVRIANAS
jgi:anti-sigma regulatory factor (Ser/Thr protein kinase)